MLLIKILSHIYTDNTSAFDTIGIKVVATYVTDKVTDNRVILLIMMVTYQVIASYVEPNMIKKVSH